MQITLKNHFWPFLRLVFTINSICSNIFVFTITKKTIVMTVDIKSFYYLQKNADFLISAPGVAKKGVGVIYQLYNFILITIITQNNFTSTNIYQSTY